MNTNDLYFTTKQDARRIKVALHKGEYLIYALLLNHDPTSPKYREPFAIGYTTSPAITLSRDPDLHWHYKEFEKPAKVQVLGVAKRTTTRNATLQLIMKLASTGYALGQSNTNKFNINRRSFPEVKSISSFSPEEMIHYLHKNPPGHSFKVWRDLHKIVFWPASATYAKPNSLYDKKSPQKKKRKKKKPKIDKVKLNLDDIKFDL